MYLHAFYTIYLAQIGDEAVSALRNKPEYSKVFKLVLSSQGHDKQENGKCIVLYFDTVLFFHVAIKNGPWQLLLVNQNIQIITDPFFCIDHAEKNVYNPPKENLNLPDTQYTDWLIILMGSVCSAVIQIITELAISLNRSVGLQI